MKIETLSSDDILAIKQYGKLFETPTEDGVKETYHALARLWHPDVALVPEVMTHINVLHEEALKALANDDWEVPGVITFKPSGKLRTYNYRVVRDFDLGKMYIGDDHLVFVIDSAYRDLYENAKTTLRRGFTFATEKMKTEFTRYLPKIDESYNVPGMHIMVMNKTPDLILLSDVIAHFNGRMDPRHAAWVISSLFNIACFLTYSGHTNNEIDIDTCLISPKFHSVALLGGWWYSAPIGKKLYALSRRSARLAPPDMLRKPVADPRLDLELIRDVGRTLVGRVFEKDVPQNIAKWLSLPSDGNAYNDYMYWKEALKKDFGPPKFVELQLTANDVYNVN